MLIVFGCGIGSCYHLILDCELCGWMFLGAERPFDFKLLELMVVGWVKLCPW